MKIYTKTGDKGETSLFGGERVSKSSLRIDAYGTVDELNACLGTALVECKDDALHEQLRTAQNELFILGSDLATPLENANTKVDRIGKEHVERLEQAIDMLDEQLPPIRFFILPGGTELASRLHVCRTVCRRAERLVVELSQNTDITSDDVLYLNRLSDYLFVAARYANHIENVPDTPWKTRNP